MKLYLLIAVSLISIRLCSQQEEIQKMNDLWNSYQASPEASKLTQTIIHVHELFEKYGHELTAETQLKRAQIFTEYLKNDHAENPVAWSNKVVDAYSSALEADQNMSKRYEILNALYQAKNDMVNKGNKAYTENDLDLAIGLSTAAIAANQLEIDHPRYSRLDTSMHFSRAVFAKIAGQDEFAIKEFEKLVSLDYNRQDIYDYLIGLYEKTNNQEKVEEIKKLKQAKFPD